MRLMVKLQKDLKEFVGLLNARGVDYLLVGAYAVAAHGLPRNTGDIDFWVRVSSENAGRLIKLLDEFGFGSLGLSATDFLERGIVVQLGRAPNRIDLLTSIDGVEFEDAWSGRLMVEIDGEPVPVISIGDLIANKIAVARPQDLADAARLREIQPSP